MGVLGKHAANAIFNYNVLKVLMRFTSSLEPVRSTFFD